LLSYINSVQKENCIFEYDSDITIDIGNGAYIKIIETGDNWDNSNDMSVVTELVYGNTKVPFTGDISSTVEENSISKFNNIDVLKLAHHGSKSSTSNSFLNVTKPQYAVVSADSNNKYGHPTSDALQRLFNSNTKVLGTFKSGNIILNINSDTFSFNKSNYLTLNDAGAKNISQSVSSNNITNETNYSYIGNKNTKKFHFSYCSSAQKINDNNKIYFVSRNNALQSGFIACKVCNP